MSLRVNISISQNKNFHYGFRFTDSDVEYLKSIMPTCEDTFFSWLKVLDCSKVKLYSIKEGSVSNKEIMVFFK